MKTQSFFKTALVAGLLAISGSSFAASSTVTTTFTGTVPNTCSMVTGTVGALVLSGGNVMTTVGGTKGSFTLTCTGTANMTIATPNPNAGTIASTNVGTLSREAFLFNPAGTQIASATGVATASSQPSGIYSVGMAFTSATPLAPGDYSSSVITTITPN